MRKNEKAVLIEGLRKLSADAAWIADTLEGKQTEAQGSETEEVAAPITETPAETGHPEEAAPAEVFSFEDARAILADKARAGYKAEVKALLTAHGVQKLSEITDPKELTKVVQEAKVIGNG